MNEEYFCKRPLYKKVDGVIIPASFSTDVFKSALRYKPKPEDLFIVTYPKCGTTWMQIIVINILRKGAPLTDHNDYFKRTPFIDMNGVEAVEKMMLPGAIKTHQPINTYYAPETKFIYVVRNPKDCCVSFYHHLTMFPSYKFQDATFDEFFELFISGQIEFNDYFDHLLNSYCFTNLPNVYHTTYESLKKDLCSSVMEVAEFLGEDHKNLLQKDPSALKNIMHYSSLDFMKGYINPALEKMHLESPDKLLKDSSLPEGRRHAILFRKHHNITPPEHMEFIRKGIVGDWKNYFSEEQEKRLDDKFKSKTSGTQILDLWKETDWFNY